jgi:hypothetical protein
VWINPYLAAGSDLADWPITRGFITVDVAVNPWAADNANTLPVDFCSPDARQWWQDRLLAPSPKRRLRRCSPMPANRPEEMISPRCARREPLGGNGSRRTGPATCPPPGAD